LRRHWTNPIYARQVHSQNSLELVAQIKAFALRFVGLLGLGVGLASLGRTGWQTPLDGLQLLLDMLLTLLALFQKMRVTEPRLLAAGRFWAVPPGVWSHGRATRSDYAPTR